MKIKLPAAILLAALIFFSSVHAQTRTANIQFDDITAEDFKPQKYSIDTGAAAVVLYDKGSAEYQPNSTYGLVIVYEYHYRVRLLRKSAFDEATIEIPLYKTERSSDMIDDLRATTYNYENGQISKSKVNKSSLFTEKSAKYIDLKKFTFPDIKEGSIIEYTYKIISPGVRNIRPWVFQGENPVLMSRYEVNVPAIFDFIYLIGGQTQAVGVTDKGSQIFGNKNLPMQHTVWTMENLPGMMKESYITSMSNYRSNIEFQLKSLRDPNGNVDDILPDWDKVSDALMKDESFGKDLKAKNKWMNDDLLPLVDSKDSVKTAENIFNFIRNRFACDDHTAFMMTNDLKKAYDEKKGNVADVNLNLIAMLIKAGIDAKPVLLSTRDNGYAYEDYPIMSRLNYLICQATVKNKVYLLDASRKKMGFNHLPQNCYNGSGRIIDLYPDLITLSANALPESKNTTIFISNDADGKSVGGHVSSSLGYYASYDLRTDADAETNEGLTKRIKKNISPDLQIKDAGTDFLTDLDDKAEVHYDFTIPTGDDIIYFNPIMGEGYKTNPFKGASRNYPIEMPYLIKEQVAVEMEIPKGYKIDELPKSEKLVFGDNEALFEYTIISDAEKIQLRSVVSFSKANFTAEDYKDLREFFSRIVKKHSEQIVFKKS